MKIEGIKKMLEGISPWPWNTDHNDTFVASADKYGHWVVIGDEEIDFTSCQIAQINKNIKFIAASPQIISQLIAQVEVMRECLEFMRLDNNTVFFHAEEALLELREKATEALKAVEKMECPESKKDVQPGCVHKYDTISGCTSNAIRSCRSCGKKQEKIWTDAKLSKCCNFWMEIYSGEEGTNHYTCLKCKQPTDGI